MTIKSLGLAALAFICSVGAAAAQSAPTRPVSRQVLRNLVSEIEQQRAKGAMPTKGPLAFTAGGASTDRVGEIPIGVHTIHADNCLWYTPDGINNYLFVFPEEGGFFATANNPILSQTFLTGCVDGDFQQVNVINSVTGAFNEVLTYPFS